jgi:glutamate-ammonia-ligase adenylyltransferase
MSPPEQAGRSSLTARLVRAGFSDTATAGARLGDPAIAPLGADPALLDALGATADPDLALLGLVRLAEAAADRQTLLATLGRSPLVRARLLGVLGVSAELGAHLARHPVDWQPLADLSPDQEGPGEAEYRRTLLTAIGADPAAPSGGSGPVAGQPTAPALDALRLAYRRALLAIAARDVCGAPLARVAADLADLASATLEAALAIARGALAADAPGCRLAVIGMGKCGGRELNYVSDVDVVFVAEPPPGVAEDASLRTATQLAAGLMRACGAMTATGTIWPVDAALRPEGGAGPLVRTLASHVAYYQRWAKTWEFQALLKARPVAGDLELGERYLAAVTPMVWAAAAREHFVEDVQAMRRRVVANIPPGQAERELKLGPGGLRDVEFSVQLLQLVHGRTDPSLRSATTLDALAALADGGYVGREDAAELDAAYRFLRRLEHRIQLFRLRRTHTLPEDPSDLRRLGRSLGLRADPEAELRTLWRQHAREVRRLHEKLFYRPLLVAVARLSPGEARLSSDAATERLEALGYADPAGALRHLEALTTGLSRRAAIQRTLLPVLLGYFADAADPDGGLLAFRQVSDALGSTPWYLRLLRDSGVAASRLATLVASGRYAPELLLRAPEAVRMLADTDELTPRQRDQLEAEMLALVGRAGDAAAAVTAVRGIRRRELFRIAAADVLGLLPADQVGPALTDVTAATVAAGLHAAGDAFQRRGGQPPPVRLAVIAMGRFGGGELSYGSDADVLFVHEPEPGVDERAAAEAANAIIGELRDLLRSPATDPALLLDADLRPEGRAGPLSRTLASYAAYYQRWSRTWESQALLRAAPIAGDAEIGARFRELIDPLRWPASGVDAADLREIRRLKARMEAERLPRGADPSTHTKLGRGGLSDVEWTVQLVQLRHAAQVPDLRTTRTQPALAAAVTAGLVSVEDAEVLAAAWRLATRVRDGVLIVRGRPSDSLPTSGRELAGVAHYLGYSAGRAVDLVEDYRRVTRRARTVVERLFYAD